ncbi:uncharacterized protein [Malus domestica]|uniref:uncharacterized protein n=1 Tax=Malus domestica TaxID=3750 RepID=UPI0039748909
MSGKCISDNSSAFSKYVASEVRDHRNLPLAKHWRKIKDVDKEAFWNRIKGNIVFKDADIPKTPLIRFMTLKEVAEKNKINRQRKTMNHTTGTKSFARKRQEYRKKHGKEDDPVTFFRECHTRKNETWIDETSERTWATMESNLQTLIQSGQEDNEDLRTRVYVDTMGPERYNRVRGYGHGVTPDMVSYAFSSSSTSISSKRSSNSAMALLMTQNNELKLKDENNNKRISDLENKQSQMFVWLFQRFQPQLQPQPPYSPGTQQSGQSQPHPPQ